MKKSFMLLLIVPLINFSQTKSIPESFSIEDRTIYWEKIYDLQPAQKITDLKEVLKLNFESDSTGTINNLECKCKGTAAFMNSPLQAKFLIYSKSGKYKVRVGDVNFDEETETRVSNVITKSRIFTLESVAIKNRVDEFRKNSQVAINMGCIDQYFTRLFTIKKQKEW